MVEQNAVAGIHAVGLAVIDGDPVGVQFCGCVRGSGVERGFFRLRCFLHFAEEFGCGSLVKPGLFFKTEDSHPFQDAQGAKGILIGSILRGLKGNRHMALGGEIVDLIRLDLLDDSDKVCGIGEIPVVENEISVRHMGALVQVVDAIRVEQGRPPFDAMYFIAFFQKEFGEERAVLAGNACD